jgi:hypothetical protein
MRHMLSNYPNSVGQCCSLDLADFVGRGISYQLHSLYFIAVPEIAVIYWKKWRKLL